MEKLVENIKLMSKQAGISVYQLEENIGIGKNTIYQWSKKTPSIDKVIKIADYFKVKLDDLVGREITEEASARIYNLKSILAESEVIFEGKQLTEKEKEALIILLER